MDFRPPRDLTTLVTLTLKKSDKLVAVADLSNPDVLMVASSESVGRLAIVTCHGCELADPTSIDLLIIGADTNCEKIFAFWSDTIWEPFDITETRLVLLEYYLASMVKTDE